LFFGTLIRNGRQNQILDNLRHSVGDNVSLLSQCNEPLICGRTKDALEQTAGDVMIVGHLPFLSRPIALLITGSEENENR
jgi:phosphohistidine phosphatase SixA